MKVSDLILLICAITLYLVYDASCRLKNAESIISDVLNGVENENSNK